MARLDWIAVYIMASRRNGTLYTGVTGDLLSRVGQHRRGEGGGFAEKYRCTMLVWHERHDVMATAIRRETQIKGWKRAWKIALIEAENPQWLDLHEDLLLPPHMRRGGLWNES